jgi:hypothetical protein
MYLTRTGLSGTLFGATTPTHENRRYADARRIPSPTHLVLLRGVPRTSLIDSACPTVQNFAGREAPQPMLARSVTTSNAVPATRMPIHRGY